MSASRRSTGPALVGVGALSLALVGAAASSRLGAEPAAPLPPLASAEEAGSAAAAAALDTAVFAGGCFWGVEAVFEHVTGVVGVTSGYAGGTAGAPTYQLVSTGTTRYAESVQVVYDPSQVSYPDLLRVFFSVAHDPTQKDRQGPDHGPQYRSAIFYRSPAQERDAREYIRQLDAAKFFPRPIVTEVSALGEFHEAEDYHQNYLVLHPDQPYIVINDKPKLAALEKQLPQLYRERKAP